MDLKFEIVKDIEKAKALWKQFSPCHTLWDDWDFRYCFYKYYNSELFFYAGYLGNEIIGLLPLQLNGKFLEFFGGEYMEENKVFLDSRFATLISEFYKNIKLKAKLAYISGDDPFTKNLPIRDFKYVYDLSNIANLDNFLDRYFEADAKKKRKRLEKEINYIETIFNNFEDLDLMIRLNMENFGKNSSFFLPHRKEIFNDLLKLQGACLTTFLVEGQKQAVSFGIKYKEKFISLNSGVNKKDFPDLPKCLILKKVDYAIKQGCKMFDACAGDYGWKRHWHLTRIPQYIYSN